MHFLAAFARLFEHRAAHLAALAMVLVGLALAEPCLHHWNWDSFAYLDAVASGKGYAPLISGRVAFCRVGMAIDAVARRVAGTDSPFYLFRAWTAAGFAFAAFALWAFGAGLRKAVGGCAAAVAVSYYVSHTNTVILWLELWPENWSVAAGLLAVGALLALPRRGRTDLWGSAVLAAASIALKETSVAFVPAMALAVLAREDGPWTRRIATAAGWGVAAVAVGLGFHLLAPFAIPGLDASQREVARLHFGGADGVDPGWTLFRENATVAAKTMWHSPVHVVLAGAGLLRALLGLRAPKQSQRLLWTAAIACAAVAGPFLLMTVAGHPLAVPRYARALVPGMGIMAALLAMPTCDGSDLRAPRWAIVAAIAALLCVADFDRATMRWHQGAAWRDFARYSAMHDLSKRPMAVVAGDDAWPANFVHLHAVGGEGGRRWFIHWPNWSNADGGRPPRDWIDAHLAEARRIAFSPSAATRAGADLPALLAEYAPLEFEEHATGWWISK